MNDEKIPVPEGTPEVPKEKPKTFEAAFRDMTMSEEEAKQLEDGQFAEITAGVKAEKNAEHEEGTLSNDDSAAVERDENELPNWVEFPPGFKIPPNKQVAFMLFRARWTDRPDKGDRWCMMWPLSDAEEKLALRRTRGESSRSLSELAKQMIHLIDGKKADWSKSPGPDSMDVERFWNEIGGRCRQQITNLYVKTHTLSAEDQKDFIENCLVVRTATVG
jgi:hypothetical protein